MRTNSPCVSWTISRTGSTRLSTAICWLPGSANRRALPHVALRNVFQPECDPLRQLRADLPFDQPQRQINPADDPACGDDVAIVDDAIGHYGDIGRAQFILRVA